jgi:hypothetical protein
MLRMSSRRGGRLDIFARRRASASFAKKETAMRNIPTLALRTRRLLDIQGFDAVDVKELAPVAPWLRMAFGLCALLGGAGTLLASPAILLVLTLTATVAAASPVHPFDLFYNYGIRHLTGTGPLPRRGAPTRFGCGMGAVLVLVTAWAFSAGHLVVGYALGGTLTFVVLLMSTTDICIPSLLYRSIFGWPPVRDTQQGGHLQTRVTPS